MCDRLLPSGSGINRGTVLEREDSSEKRLVFSFGYQHMNENGYYAGWTEHMLYVTPSFDGIDQKITGRSRNQIKDYLYDVYHAALTQEIEI